MGDVAIVMVTDTTAAAAALVKAGAAATPVVSCAQLAAMDFSQVVPGAPTQITSATVTTISGASYCEVQGIQPPQLFPDQLTRNPARARSPGPRRVSAG